MKLGFAFLPLANIPTRWPPLCLFSRNYSCSSLSSSANRSHGQPRPSSCSLTGRSSNSLHRPLPHPPPSASHPAPCLPPPAAPNSLYFNKHPPALAPDDILRPVQIYLVLPAAMLEKTQSTADMGALAVRASTTLMASSSDKSLAMAVTRVAPHPSSSTVG